MLFCSACTVDPTLLFSIDAMLISGRGRRYPVTKAEKIGMAQITKEMFVDENAELMTPKINEGPALLQYPSKIQAVRLSKLPVLYASPIN